MTSDDTGRPSFHAYVDWLALLLEHRAPIVERLQEVLNAQRRPLAQRQDRSLVGRQIAESFLVPGVDTVADRKLRHALLAAHWSSGFRPSQVPGLHNDIIDPAELALRVFHLWQQTRWPGRNGRVRYAQTLFNLCVLRQLVLLVMRIWDEDPAGAGERTAAGDRPVAGERLARVQALLDALWQSAPADQPVFVRDARWLIPLAQSPTTDDLAAYFEVAAHVAESLPPADRLEIQQAHVRILGGHLCSQLRHYCLKDNVAMDDPSVIRRTRTSNALDFALLVQGLVFLLEAYQDACEKADDDRRQALAGAIFQGLSPDPELFLRRIDLLGAYSMIEDVFVVADAEGQAAYTELGRRHLKFWHRYQALIPALAERLADDCERFRPLAGGSSPYGVMFGAPANLIEEMALKAVEPGAEARFSLEDVFVDGGADRLAWVRGWRQLPHVSREVQSFYDYPQAFAEEIHDRIVRTLQACLAQAQNEPDFRTGMLLSFPNGESAAASSLPNLPARYLRSSDPEIVSLARAEACDEATLLHERREGHYVVSVATAGGWLAVTKDFLSEVVGEGRDAKLVGLPPAANAVIALMCPGLVESG